MSIQDEIKEELQKLLQLLALRKEYILTKKENTSDWKLWAYFIAQTEADIAYMQDALELLKDCKLTYDEYLILDKIFNK